MEKLISIVVPIYNIEKYVEKCINSIIQQTYKNIEIILVDDGSTDNSPFICNNFKKKDPRIRVFNQKNQGPSSARNIGVWKSKGEYIVFVDGDDVVAPFMIEELVNTINNGKEVGICNICHCFEGDEPVFDKKNTSDILPAEKAIKMMLYQKNFLVSPCGKIFKKQILIENPFDVGRIFEDSAIMYKLLDSTSNIIYNQSHVYAYMHRKNSITTSDFSINNCEILKISEEICDYFKNRSRSLIKASNAYLISSSLRVYLNAKDNDKYKYYISKSINNIEKLGKKVLFDKETRYKTKVALLLFFISRPLLKKIYKNINNWR